MSAAHFMCERRADKVSAMYDGWEDVVLYKPNSTDQALTYESADCLATEALLRMTQLPFSVDERPNAEFMSPTGRVPFLKVQSLVIPEFLQIADFIGKKGARSSEGLDGKQQFEMDSLIAMFDETLRNVEIYMVWINDHNYKKVTRCRYGSVYHWPLNVVLPAMKRREMRRYLSAIDWLDMSQENVIEIAERCFKAASSKLSGNDYFIGDTPTELDALAFGHIYTILTTTLPNRDLLNCVYRFSNLVDFCRRIDKQYFNYSATL